MSNCKSAHRYSSLHRQQLLKDHRCGCFYCRRIFTPVEITAWTDDGQTALCPHCGADAVIGESCGIPITEEFLKEMHDFWF